MGLGWTVALLLAAVAVAGYANWQERRPPPADPPLVSYTAIQMLAVVLAILMLAHLVSLLSGHPLTSRFGR